MSQGLLQLFSSYAGTAFAKQLAFADFLGERSWHVDLTLGSVSFGEDMHFPLQLIGSEAYANNSWLWAWANQASCFPDALLSSVRQLKALGQQKNITELTEPGASLETVNGHMLAMLASGLSSKSCYYCGPYEGGALFFLVRNVPAEITGPVSVERAITVITQGISTFELEHRRFAESFLRQQKFELQATDNGFSARRQQSELILDFDELDRIVDIRGTIAPNTAD